MVNVSAVPVRAYVAVHSPAFTRSATSTTRRAVTTPAPSAYRRRFLLIRLACAQQNFSGGKRIDIKIVIADGVVDVARSFGIFSSNAASTFSLNPVTLQLRQKLLHFVRRFVAEVCHLVNGEMLLQALQ